MAPKKDKSGLKRGRHSGGDNAAESFKKPRRSERISSQVGGTPLANDNAQLPSPLTHQASTATDSYREGTVTPPEGRPSQIRHRTPVESSPSQLNSPPQDTQPFSQFVHPAQSLALEVEDEEKEGVWGYLVPLDEKWGETMILRRREACPAPFRKNNFGKGSTKRQREGIKNESSYEEEEEKYEKDKAEKGIPAGGYLIGRHPECDRVLELPTISNRHCLLFNENKRGGSVAVLEDLSSNGTFVNEALIGRNKRRELEDNDEISILDGARFVFRYPRNREGNAFSKQYRVLEQLGKGHFATVYLCVERATGNRFAVKRFEKRPGDNDRSKSDGLQQEIAVLMSVSHPNMMCLKDTFDEKDGVYLVLELAAQGELFNWIVAKQKLTEAETRRVFIQLFQGIKYLHERNIVHRDIKPENILVLDKELTVKLADFGLAKIIGEESFTSTLCGTPSYVAPEILENSKHRRYTRAVDIWSLGVVLYICLCGLPPFSDELYTPESPYNLSQQIKLGRFDYPSPYWDSVGDPALDLIDKMLTVDAEKRITVEECLRHPWLTQQDGSGGNGVGLKDSTDGLVGRMGELDFSKRKFARERTLLSSLNDVKVSKEIQLGDEEQKLKVWEKRPAEAPAAVKKAAKNGSAKGARKEKLGKELTPAAGRGVKEFAEMGGKGDQVLFANGGESRYMVDETLVELEQGTMGAGQ